MLINNDSINLMPKVLNQLVGNLGYYKDLQTYYFVSLGNA